MWETRLSRGCLVIGMVGISLVLMAQSRPIQAPQQLKKLTQEFWAFHLKEHPQFASAIGDRRYDDKLDDMSQAGIRRRAKAHQQFMLRLKAISPQQLPEQDKINWAILQRWLHDQIAEYRLLSHLIPITNRYGFHIEFPGIWRQLPFKTIKHFQDYIVRLRAFRVSTQQHINLLQQGLKNKHTLPAVVLKGYEKTITPHIVKKAEASLMYKPFLKMPSTIPTAKQKQLKKAAQKAITTSVVPAYQAFHTFMTKTYIPNARKTIGVSQIPKGKAFYRHRVRRFTTLPLTPAQVHQTGLKEVKRIRKEMEAVIRQVKFKGNFADFLKFLRTDPRFYAKTPKELLRHVSYVLKRMDGKLPKLFGTLPRLSYGIRKIPDYIAPRTTTAYYMPGSGDGTRAGFYYVNTHNLKSRPFYEVMALSFHEAVPGHHLQIALQQERKNLPPFRRYFRAMSYQEGWALYAERLGLEVGFYKDPYNNFGRLTYEMWRACRLVVDTGIHMMGWTRQRAIQYMTKHTALAIHNIHAEVDRYISWPGQALAYKIGELKIRQLRTYATQALGTQFNLRYFHDEILRHGALPLDILEQQIKAWVNRRRFK